MGWLNSGAKPEKFAASGGVSLTPEFIAAFTGGQVIPGGVMTRKAALQVPGVIRARDLICGGVGQLGVTASSKAANTNRQAQDFVSHPEKHLPPVVTYSRLIEDLFFDGQAVWVIDDKYADGFPRNVHRPVLRDGRTLAPWHIDDDGDLHVGGPDVKPIKPGGYIHFPLAFAGLLEDGANAVRTASLISALAMRNAKANAPVSYFKPTDSYNMTEAELATFLTAWNTAREKAAVGYIPDGLEYVVPQINNDADTLALKGPTDAAILEISRATGIDPEYLAVSTTSRTYANMFERRQFMIDFTFDKYVLPVQQRLSMNDVTPTGTDVAFDVDGWTGPAPTSNGATRSENEGETEGGN